MIINMTTFAGRTKHYLEQTLESLFRSDGRDIPVNLILGSRDESHVERYRNVANIVPWDAEAEALARQDDLRRNCSVNALRALKYGDDDYCLCCEDDIGFKEDWFSQLMLTVEQIARHDYVLNLGQASEPVPGKRYAPHTRPYLCGAQAIFYPSKSLRNSIADYLGRNIGKATNDTLVGRYAKENCVLYNTCPRLIRHIGQVSSFCAPDRNARGETAPPTRKAAAEARSAAERQTHPAPSPPRARSLRPRGSAKALTAEVFVALLRASLGTAPPPDASRLEQCDWPRLERLALHHGLGAVLYRSLQSHVAGIPVERLRSLKFHYVTNAFRSQQANVCLEQLGAAFGTERIPVIVTKGAALLRTLYDDPGLRIIGDVDLLVDERDVERAGAQLERMGLRQHASSHADERGPLCHIHLVYCRPEPRSVPVELHWRLFEPYQPYVFDLDAVRAHARQLPGLPANVFVMAPEHELAHLCVHLERHAVAFRSLVGRADWRELLLLPQGLGRLVWLYDIALYLQRRSSLIDWDAFVDTARRWAMDDRVHATLELSRRVFGIGPPQEVLSGLQHGRPRFVERLAHRAVLASHRAHELPVRPRWLPLSGHILRFANTWISLFPPDAYLRARYDAQDSPLWLRGRHLREVVPGLWAETRDRLRAAAARHRHE